MPTLIQLNIPFILILFLAVVAGGIAYLFYRVTNPPLPTHIRWLLLLIRGVVIFLLLFLFFAPTLHLYFVKQKPVNLAVFVDNSASMNVNDGESPRWTQVQKAVEWIQNNLPNVEITWFAFNTHVEPVNEPTSLQPTQKGTNFKEVLSKIRKKNFEHALIISDGVITQGEYPSLSSPMPGTINAIMVGSVHRKSDVLISDVKYAPVAYRNKPQEITVFIDARALSKKQKIVVQLLNKKRVLTNRHLQLQKGDGTYQLKLTYRLKRLGLQPLTVRLSGLTEDTNPYNNEFQFVQEVQKSRIGVALIASAPGYDVKFLKFILSKSTRFQVFPFVENNRGRFLQKASLNLLDSSDVWILVDFPGKRSSNVFFQLLQKARQKRNPSVLIFAGPQLDRSRLKMLLPVPHFALKTLQQGGREVNAIPQWNEETATFLNLYEDELQTERFWNRVPPVRNFYRTVTFPENGRVLFNAFNAGRTIPMVVLFEHVGSKIGLFNGLGFWRWHFLMQNERSLSDGYRIFVEKLLHDLQNRQPFKPLTLTVDRKTAQIGQTFKIEARIVDSRYRPLKTGNVVFKVRSGKQRFDLSAARVDTGQFQAVFTPSREGKFTIEAIGFQQGERVAQDSLNVFVIPVNKEFVHLSPDSVFLGNLTSSNNGKVFKVEQLEQLKQILGSGQEMVSEEQKIELWYLPLMLISILLLITIEWVLRKRFRLV